MSDHIIRDTDGRILLRGGATNLRDRIAEATRAGADLQGADLQYGSHDLMAETLRQAAGADLERLQFAGLVSLQRQWCWPEFLASGVPALDWALDTLAATVPQDRVDDPTVPDCLRTRARARLTAVTGVTE